jgi:hypothetical protein
MTLPTAASATTTSAMLAATASDDTGVVGVTFWVNGVKIGSEDTTAPYRLSWDTTATTTGVKSVVAVARDAAGNYATSTPVSFTVYRFLGSGTSGSPYLITECAQLPFINDSLDATYSLMRELDCRTLGDDAAIGTLASPFTGTFDGNNNELEVTITLEAENAVGLFRATNGALIQDLVMGGSGGVQGSAAVGNVVGYATNTTLLNVFAGGQAVSFNFSPSEPDAGLGGLVGVMDGGAIYGSGYFGLMGGGAVMGGLVGTMKNGALISRSAVQAQILGVLATGGIAGYVLSGSEIRNSSAFTLQGSLEFLEDAIGFVGVRGGIAAIMADGVISRSYSTGSIDATRDDAPYPAGGLVAMIGPDALIAHSFSTTDISGTGGGLIGGVLEGSPRLVNNYFNTDLSGETCYAAVGEVEGCTGVAAGSLEDAYWGDMTHEPLPYYNFDIVWEVGAEAPSLRAYLGEEPLESDELPSEDEEEGGDSEPEPTSIPTPTPHGGGGIVGLMGTEPYKGFGYVEPRMQIVFPDGRIVYPDEPVKPTLPAPSVAKPQSSYKFTRDLQTGVSGKDVVQVQEFLIAQGFAIPAGATGYFGSQTRTALVAFQKAHGITPAAGYFGPKTKAFIGKMTN